MKKSAAVLLPVLLCICILTGSCVSGDAQSESEQIVHQYLNAKKSNDYALWSSAIYNFSPGVYSGEIDGDLAVINLNIHSIADSADETARMRERYRNSALAKENNWTDSFIESNLIAVYASYFVDYDNAKVPYDEGDIEQYFYLTRSDQDSRWYIWEQSYDVSE